MGRWAPALAGLVIAAAAWAAYANSFSAPFVFDDILGIERNPALRSLWPLTGPLRTTADTTLSGRPVASLSFALSYKASGLRVEGYHGMNLLIHVLAGLALLGILGRTFDKVGTGGPPVRAAAESKADTDGGAGRPY